MSRPTARPAALSQRAESPRKHADSHELPLKTDRENSRPVRVRAERLAHIATELTDTDRAVLEFLARTRLATGTQLARRLWASENPSDRQARAARRALHRLEDLRLIGRLGRRMGGVRAGSSSIVYRLESAGHRLTSQERRQPAAIHRREAVLHTLSVTELVVQVHERTVHSELRTKVLQTEPACWRSYPGPLGSHLTLRPDLFIALAGPVHEDRWFVEVDLDTEYPGRLRTKARRYLDHFQTGDEQHRHGAYPRVIWTAPHRERAQQLTRVLHALEPPAKALFIVWQFDEVAGRLIAEGTA